VRDEQGRKMSKSLGNIIDPLDMIAKYGTDATRLSLLLGSTPGNDMKLSEEKIAGYRNFTNKLWNISRFILLNIENPRIDIAVAQKNGQTLADEWILSRLNETIKTVTENIEKYNFSYAGETLRDFTWNDLADWYLEIAKIEKGKDEILNYILNTILKLWHPYMPFVTETIWQEVYGGEAMLMVENWPDVLPIHATRDFSMVQAIIVGIRATRAEHKIEPAKLITAFIKTGETYDWLEETAAIIRGLARIESLTISTELEKPVNSLVGFVDRGVEVYIDLAGAVDIGKEKIRLEKEMATVAPYVAALKNKLSNQEFAQNAPAAVVEAEQKKLAEAEEKLKKLEQQLENI
jgi:valyl-tRNA synthetase